MLIIKDGVETFPVTNIFGAAIVIAVVADIDDIVSEVTASTPVVAGDVSCKLPVKARVGEVTAIEGAVMGKLVTGVVVGVVIVGVNVWLFIVIVVTVSVGVVIKTAPVNAISIEFIIISMIILLRIISK